MMESAAAIYSATTECYTGRGTNPIQFSSTNTATVLVRKQMSPYLKEAYEATFLSQAADCTGIGNLDRIVP